VCGWWAILTMKGAAYESGLFIYWVVDGVIDTRDRDGVLMCACVCVWRVAGGVLCAFVVLVSL